MKLPRATITFTAKIYTEFSYGTSVSIGTRFNSMSLFFSEDVGYILWNFGVLAPDEDEVCIGISVEDNKLCDYDGVFSLPKQAILLLEAAGIDASYAKEDEAESKPEISEESKRLKFAALSREVLECDLRRCNEIMGVDGRKIGVLAAALKCVCAILSQPVQFTTSENQMVCELLRADAKAARSFAEKTITELEHIK